MTRNTFSGVTGLIFFIMIVCMIGCGSSSSSGGAGTITPSMKLATSTSSTTVNLQRSYDLTNQFIPGGGRIDLLTGSAVSSIGGGLSSLKYFITSIQICQNMTTSGTAFSNQSGCITLYSGPTDSTLNPSSGSVSNFIAAADYARSHTTGFIDLMSASSRSALNSAYTIKSSDAGSYKWGLVNWAYPIKVTATVSSVGSGGSAFLYTHDGTTQAYTNPSGFYGTVSSTPLTTAPASEAVVVLPNGGSWFRFQNPFVISASDVGTTSYALDLTFNPDGIIQGSTTAPSNGPAIVDGSISSPGNAISVPMLDITPVPRKSTDTTVKESYNCTASGWTQDLRLELYYLNSDSSKTIYGASIAGILNANSTGIGGNGFQKVASITSNSDGSLNFLDWSGSATVSGFTRKSTVGQTTSATVSSMSPTSATCTLNTKAALQ